MRKAALSHVEAAMRTKYQGVSAGTRRRFLGSSAGAMAVMSLAGLGLTAGGAARANEYGILDQPAPELDVDYWLDRDGMPTHYTIGASRGKWIFLECFQNWCPGCHSHGFPTLKKVADAFDGDDRVSVAAVQTVFEGFSNNTQEAVRELQLRYELPIPMGHDPGTPEREGLPSTMVRYRTGGTPWVIIIEPGGTVAFNNFHIDGDKFIALLKEQLA
jgi:thiol-disulfide isomerase/thioredoxin